MQLRGCLYLLLFAGPPLWAQAIPTDEPQMLVPPPVSSEGYPTMVGSEMRSNYITAGLTFDTAYDDNVLAGAATTTVRDFTYSVWPTLRLNLTTPRQQLALIYSPGFTFYQHTTALDAADQDANLNFQYRLSEHTTVMLNGFFQKSSNVFSLPNLLSGVAISGTSQSSTEGVVAPYADRLSDATNVELSRQFSENGMFGFGGSFSQSNYPNPTEASGLYNTKSVGGTAFYSHRFSGAQYAGATYQYLNSQADPADVQASPNSSSINVQTHTVLPFYTVYFNPTLSLSLAAGPQHVDATQGASASFITWKPSATASFGWQSKSTNVVASYSRTVTGQAGLPGAFASNSANASVRWQVFRSWIVQSGAAYAINKNLTPLFSPSSPGGHSVSGTVSLEYSTSNHFKAELGYMRLHQSYSGLGVISTAPDSDREFVSVSYQFTRAIRR